jgi:hypothetical protein
MFSPCHIPSMDTIMTTVILFGVGASYGSDDVPYDSLNCPKLMLPQAIILNNMIMMSEY